MQNVSLPRTEKHLQISFSGEQQPVLLVLLFEHAPEHAPVLQNDVNFKQRLFINYR
jgi:hypothetical protein